jgi:hypothetical protein
MSRTWGFVSGTTSDRINAKVKFDGGRDDRDGVVALEREIDKGSCGSDWLVPAFVTARCAS